MSEDQIPDLKFLDREGNMRRVWKKEPKHFTPWVQEDATLERLNAALGLNLDRPDLEVKLPSLSADMVCRDLGSGSTVVIENQISPESDHKHLGQLLTYASLIEAGMAIWIAPTIRDEHRFALDRLNSIFGNRLKLFGVELSLWEIDDSLLAPIFTVVARPSALNEVSANVRLLLSRRDNRSSIVSMEASSASVATSETESETGASLDPKEQLSRTEETLRRYWSKFLESHGTSLGMKPGRKPQPKTYLTMGIGCKGYHVNAAIALSRQQIRVELYLDGPHAKAHLQSLMQKRVQIEENLGYEVTWGNPSSKANQMIVYEASVHQYDDENDWERQHKWLADKMNDFRREFKQVIQTLNSEVPNRSGEDAPTVSPPVPASSPASPVVSGASVMSGNANTTPPAASIDWRSNPPTPSTAATTPASTTMPAGSSTDPYKPKGSGEDASKSGLGVS